MILFFCESKNIRNLWNENYSAMLEDYARNGIPEDNPYINTVLNDINRFLEQQHKTIYDYDLPEITLNPNDQNYLLISFVKSL